MRRALAYIVLIAGVASVIAIGLWLYSRQHGYEVRVLVGEARLNPWLAISILFEKQDLAVRQESPFQDELSPSILDTVVVQHGPYTIVTNSQSSLLERWVSAGGTLVYRVSRSESDEEETQQETQKLFPMSLGVDLSRDRQPVDVSIVFGELSSCSPDHALEIALGQSPPLKLQNSNSTVPLFELSPIAQEFQTEILGAGVLRMNFGRGLIYFVSDLEQWTNPYVRCVDNAFILYTIVSGFGKPNRKGDPPTMWILPMAGFPSLLELIWKNAPQVVIGMSLALLVMIFIWNIRLSPPVYETSGPRRGAYEYATSAAKFAWRNKDIQAFFRALSSIALREHFSVNKDRRIANQIRHLEKDQSQIRRALWEEKRDLSESEVVEQVRLIQAELRKD